MIKGCIFDLDGTLADTLHSIAHFGNRALEQYGFKPIETQIYRQLVGNGAKQLVHKMLDQSANDSEENFNNVSTLYNKTYEENCLYLTQPYDGVLPLLSKLKEAGIQLAVLSNKPHSTTIRVVEGLFAPDCFAVCFGQRDHVPRKPDPQGVYEILTLLGLDASECLYVGDTKTDMETGRNAGLFTIGVSWGFRGRRELETHGADAVIDRPDELMQFVK